MAIQVHSRLGSEVKTTQAIAGNSFSKKVQVLQPVGKWGG